MNRAELAISSIEGSFRVLFAASPDAMVLIDPHDPEVSWPIIDCNDAACRMNGYGRDELLGRSVDVLNSAPGTRGERAAYLRRLREEGVVALEAMHRHRDGHVFPVEISTSLVMLDGRELVLGVDRDISRRKRDEEELRRAGEERRQLLAQLASAQEEERRRVAQDIHDDSIQVMTAVGLGIGAIGARLDPRTRREMEALEETVEQAITRLRHLLFQLRPSSLDRDGLVTTLREYAEHLLQDGGPPVTVDGELDPEPSPQARVLLYRLAQEALVNVKKHARASAARVSLRWEMDGVLAHIEDDGVGFDPERAKSAMPVHIGLISMRERAELGGGWSRVDTELGEGTTVSFWIPDPASMAMPRREN